MKRINRDSHRLFVLRYVPYGQACGQGYGDMCHREPSLEKIAQAIGYAPKTCLNEILDIVIADMRARIKRGD